MNDTNLATIAAILAVMLLLAWLETLVPLRTRGRWNRQHLRPNLTLTFITFATNAFMNGALVLLLAAAGSAGIGLLHAVAPPPLAANLLVVLVLDLSYYVAHRAMHASPALWRFHCIHHSDPAVDVTTTIRQHPGDGAIRYAFLAVAAVAIGASPGAFAVYRVWSALGGLLEHANLRMPRRLDTWLSLLVATPNMHKVHHSRTAAETDSNYGNIFSVFDRACSTFTPSVRGESVAYGLDGFDEPATQTATGLLGLPFRRGGVPGDTVALPDSLPG